ncbi:MAG: hypothetical protein IKS48_02740 [Eubacterium sp.]|nr:hypothetical protein [Eubacterium sp.]
MKKVLTIILTIVAAIVFEIVYVFVEDVGIDKIVDLLDIELFAMSDILSFLILVCVTIAGIIVLVRCKKRAGKYLNLLTFSIFTVAALVTNILFFMHETIVYYHLHGDFMPLSLDFGYAFFLLFLGIPYICWILGILVVLLIRLIKKKL